jgi:hypothetical protein
MPRDEVWRDQPDALLSGHITEHSQLNDPLKVVRQLFGFLLISAALKNPKRTSREILTYQSGSIIETDDQQCVR